MSIRTDEPATALSAHLVASPNTSRGTAPTPPRTKSNLMARLSIRTKLTIISLLGSLTALAIAGFALTTLNTVQKDTENLERGITQVIDSFTDLTNKMWQLRLDVALSFAESGLEANIQRKAMIEEEIAKAHTSLETYQGFYDIPENKDLEAALKAYEDIVMNEFLPIVLSGDAEKTDQFRANKVSPAADKLFIVAEDIGDNVNTEAANIAANSAVAVNRAFITTIVIAAIGILLTMVLSSVISQRIRRNISALNESIAALAHGDLTVAPNVTGQDELGDMADQLRTAQDSLRTTLRGVAENADDSVRKAEVLSAASSQVAASSAETSAQAAVVATAAEQVSGNVQTVAAGAEQMSASIREIAQNAQEATAVAQTAATTADSTNITISRLGDSSKEIGDVIKTITSIAEQTNLLALNATIEAARAGEAGKGFAVVASEVKDLAAESARAADDVARRVQAIQTDTDSAIGAIGQISEIISTINNYQLTIASAVEEQTATTNEMSRSAAEAATGSSEIAANINGVAAVVEESTAAVAEMDRTIAEVSAQAQALSDDVHTFKY